MGDDAKTAGEATRWDLTPLYSSLTGDDFRRGVATLEQNTANLETFFDQHHVRRLPRAPQADETLGALAGECLRLVNDLLLLADRLEGFVSAIVSTDSYNDAAQRELSKLDRMAVGRRQLAVRLNGWIGSLGDQLPRLIAMRPELQSHAFFLTDTAKQSRWLMNEDLESLAAELALDAGGAFGKLQGNVTSQLKVPFERDRKTETLPITVIRNLSFDPDRAVRKRAYQTEIAGWESIRTTVAACMNGVKGTALTLAKRRGRHSVLDVSLDQNKIDRPTLDALLGSIREAFPMFRRYLRSKARKLGVEQLAWWDLFAPLGHANRRFSWDEARDFIIAKFTGFSPDLGSMAGQAFAQRWIDGLPRDGKRGGAFCMDVMAIEQSRVLANFDGSFEQVSTLAHELGHAFHNHCQSGLEPLQRGAPMTLAETASIFCETLIAEAALEGASHDERLMILEAQLSGATQVCLDISSRFMFESAVFDERQTGELSADDLCKLMTTAQGETYGDAIEPATYHPYMWLWKPHYYSYDLNYYNFPYAFGHLFALGLMAEYRRQGPKFVARYQDLLRSTGQDYAAPLVARFGIDITKPDFWRRSLGIIDEQVKRYEAL